MTVTDASANTRTVEATFVATTDPPVVGEPGIVNLTGFSTAGGAYTMGYSFTVDETTQLTAAGIFDSNGNGTLDNPASVEIGVWRRSDQQLLWQGSVPTDTALDDGWFYVDVADPIELEAGVEYVIGQRVFNGGEPRVNANGTAEKADGFTIVRYAYRSINRFAYPNSQGGNAVGYGTPNVKLGQPVIVVPRSGSTRRPTASSTRTSSPSPAASPTTLVGNQTTRLLDFVVTDVAIVAEPGITSYTPGDTPTGAYRMGYSFTVDEATEVLGIGIFDTNGNGSLDNPADAEVAIWRQNGQTLLASGIVSPDAESENGWFYGTLDAPVRLDADEFCVVGYRQFSNGEPWAYNGSMERTDGFTIRQYAYRSINGFAYPNSQGTNAIGYGVPNLLLGEEQRISPVVSVASPEDEIFFQNAVVLSGTVTDNVEVASVSARLTDDAGRFLQSDGTFATAANDLDLSIAGLNTAEATWSRNLGRLAVGDYTLTVNAIDSFTNFASSTGNYTMGFTFTVPEETSVHELGIFDTNGNGTLDNPADTPIGGYRMWSGGEPWAYNGRVAIAADAPDLTIVRYAYRSISGFAYPSTQAGTSLDSLEYGVPNLMLGTTPVVVDLPPVVQPIADQTARVNTAIAPVQVEAADPEGEALTYSVDRLPAGVSLSADGRISGTPIEVGETISTVTVSDPGGAEVTVEFSWQVNHDPGDGGGGDDAPCVAVRQGDDVELTWQPIDGEDDAYQIRRNGGWLAVVAVGAERTYTDDGAPAGATYAIRSREAGVTIDVPCTEGGGDGDGGDGDGGDGGGGNPDEPACRAQFGGADRVTLTWDPVPGENDNYQIRRNGSWAGNIAFDARNTWEGTGAGGDVFVIRSREGGVNTDLVCE